MCLLNYEFHILDNAFLIHRPGIKSKKELKETLNTRLVKILMMFFPLATCTITIEMLPIFGSSRFEDPGS